MISTEPVAVVVRTDRAGQYADRRVDPEFPPSWHRRALCRAVDTGVFFPADEGCHPQRPHRELIAKVIYAACPVRRPCATYALVHGELHGACGGMSEADRRRRLPQP